MFGGKGGDGCVSFLSLWCNENAGPDGGDGGNGGHVVLKSTYDVNNLNHISSIIRAEDGEKGTTKNCHGKNANHNFVPVPVGTVVKNVNGKVVGDLSSDGLMFVAARGGAGGKGNRFFITEREYAPKIAELGAIGEQLSYVIELRSMAHIGLVILRRPTIRNEFDLKKKSFSDWLSQRRKEYAAASDNKSKTENCIVSIHNVETSSRYG